MENLHFVQQSLPTDYQRSHVVVFTSGKCGVGKTCITTNVATAMAQRGVRVCVFDADIGLANINILLGLHPEYTLEHVLNSEKSIQEILIKTKAGVTVVPGASGVAEFANLAIDKVARLSAALSELESEYEYFLIDTAAGAAESVLQFIESSPYAFVVITPEPTSLTDAFSLLKILNERDYSGRVRVIVNMAADYPNATETYRRFASAVEKYLNLKVEYGGFVARDENVPKSVIHQMPVIDLASNSPASRSLVALADNMLKYIGADNHETGLADYWTNFLLENDPSDNRLDKIEPIQAFEATPQIETARTSENNWSIAELTAQLLTAIKTETSQKDTLERFTSEFLAAFLAQFGSFPQAFRQLLFRWLEAENYAAPRLLELTGTLETLYMTKHQQPLHSLEDSAARLISQCRDSPDNLGNLIKQLRIAYRQAFQEDVFDAYQEILDSIHRHDCNEEQFQQLQDSLIQAFQTRFKRPYQKPSDLLLESTVATLAEMANDEQKLQAQMDALNHSFQQLNTRRAALQAALSESVGVR